MQSVRLGRTNAQVSVAGLGCGGHSRLGLAHGATAGEAARLVQVALDLGISFVDTAQAYGTEEAVGLGLAGRRDQVFISTKSHTHGADQAVITPEALTWNLEASLRRLKTDRVDLFNLHGVPAAHYAACVEVLLPELKRQQAAGKIRFLGITEQFGGDTRHEMLSRAIPDGHFDVVMVGFNLLNPSARAAVFPQTLAHDIGTQIMFAVRRAISQPEALRELMARLVASGEVDGGAIDLADPLGFLREAIGSEVEAAYRFCRHEPGAQVILTGTGSVGHLQANVEAIQKAPLPVAVSERLRALFGAVDSVSGN